MSKKSALQIDKPDAVQGDRQALRRLVEQLGSGRQHVETLRGTDAMIDPSAVGNDREMVELAQGAREEAVHAGVEQRAHPSRRA